MLGRTYDDEVCSAARALEVVGERWTLLIVRDAMFAGSTRFVEFQRGLGLAPNVLSKRLDSLVSAGVLDADGGAASHGRYRLTEMGWDLQPIVIALTRWGDRWAPDARGRPVAYRHRACGGEVGPTGACDSCGALPTGPDVVADVADWVRPERAARRTARTAGRATTAAPAPS